LVLTNLWFRFIGSVIVAVLGLFASAAAFVPSHSSLGVRPRLSPLGLSTADFKNGMTIEFDGKASALGLAVSLRR